MKTFVWVCLAVFEFQLCRDIWNKHEMLDSLWKWKNRVPLHRELEGLIWPWLWFLMPAPDSFGSWRSSKPCSWASHLFSELWRVFNNFHLHFHYFYNQRYPELFAITKTMNPNLHAYIKFSRLANDIRYFL